MANLVKTPDSIKRKSQKHSQEIFSDQLAIVGISGFQTDIGKDIFNVSFKESLTQSFTKIITGASVKHNVPHA